MKVQCTKPMELASQLCPPEASHSKQQLVSACNVYICIVTMRRRKNSGNAKRGIKLQSTE
jgi:hypothetical protein